MNCVKICVIAMSVLCLASCASMKEKRQVNPAYATYAEPQDGPRARARLTGPGWKMVYPGTSCDRGLYPGAGKPGGPRLGGGFARLDLGMPKLGDKSKPLEIYLRADEPVTIEFYEGGQGNGYVSCPPAMPGYRSICHQRKPQKVIPPCRRMQTFIPEAGKDYDIAYAYVDDTSCQIDVFEIVADGGGSYRRDRMPSQPAPACLE